MAVVERKYALTRIKAGDYLLPSNDGATLFRLATYEEDGSAEYVTRPGAKARPLVGTFWAVYRRPMPPLDQATADLLEWSDAWEWIAGPLDTRQQAIDEALHV